MKQEPNRSAKGRTGAVTVSLCFASRRLSFKTFLLRFDSTDLLQYISYRKVYLTAK